MREYVVQVESNDTVKRHSISESRGGFILESIKKELIKTSNDELSRENSEKYIVSKSMCFCAKELFLRDKITDEPIFTELYENWDSFHSVKIEYIDPCYDIKIDNWLIKPDGSYARLVERDVSRLLSHKLLNPNGDISECTEGFLKECCKWVPSKGDCCWFNDTSEDFLPIYGKFVRFENGIYFFLDSNEDEQATFKCEPFIGYPPTLR